MQFPVILLLREPDVVPIKEGNFIYLRTWGTAPCTVFHYMSANIDKVHIEMLTEE